MDNHKSKGQNEGNIVYYNLEIATANNLSIGILNDRSTLQQAEATILSNIPILKNCINYFGSIIRLEFPGEAIPLIQFAIQSNPVTDINKGIYSFTLNYNGIDSDQIFYNFIPEITTSNPPVNGTLKQDFQNPYYFLYDYDQIVQIMNNTISSAFANLLTKPGTEIIATAKVPFFNYSADENRLSLYTDPLFYDLTNPAIINPIRIYWNYPSYVYLTAFPYFNYNIGSILGKDNYFNISSNNDINIVNIPNIPTGVNYIKTTQAYVSIGYMSPLKSIQIVTTNGIKPEGFNINVNTTNQNQSIQYTNVITDFLPDVSQPTAGVSSYRQIYNAPSLYRLWEFKNNDPLYEINASIYWQDFLGNTYPLYLSKGQSVLLKYMFIEKSLISDNLIKGSMI